MLARPEKLRCSILLILLLQLPTGCKKSPPTSTDMSPPSPPSRTVLFFALPLAGQVQNIQAVTPERVSNVELQKAGVRWLETATKVRDTMLNLKALHIYPYRGPSTDKALQDEYWAEQEKALLQADGVIFVVDSQMERMPANADVLDHLRKATQERQRQGRELPVVVQLNKRDLPNAESLDGIAKLLPMGGWPTVEAVADQDKGVRETLDQMALAFAATTKK